jgi:hypothetical protein
MAMPELTRRPHPERSDCWHIFYGDVHVGTIAIQSGLPVHAEQWRWDVGFYPASHRGRLRSGYASSFDQARAGFEAAWKDYLPLCSEVDFVEYRRQRDWTARKYAMRERGERMPTQKPNSMMPCPCGETFDSHKLEHTLIHVPHITAAQRKDGIVRR